MGIKNKHILNNHIKEVKQGEKFLRSNLKKLGYLTHGGKITNAILIKLKMGNLQLLKNYLKKENLYKSRFFKPISNFVRISLCTPKKLSIFLRYFKSWHKSLK